MLRLAVDNERPCGDYTTGPRPCPWSDCRYHLKHAEESCALEVSDRGEHTLQKVGDLLGLSIEGVRKIEMKALKKLSDVTHHLHDDLGRPGKQLPRLPLSEQILLILTNEGEPLTASQLAELCDSTHENVRSVLHDMQRRNCVVALPPRGPLAKWALVNNVSEAA